MAKHILKVTASDKITHDVLRIRTEKPLDFQFKPGQATEVAINKEEWKNEFRPFTFTSLPKDDFLEFTIKTYPSHAGVTNELLNLKANDELIVGDAWGTIAYKGKGVFIAGGAGITPFISIFRELQAEGKLADNKLIFANKTFADIINRDELQSLLGANFVNILSDEQLEGYGEGFISLDFLKQNSDRTDQYFYVCGPRPMMKATLGFLKEMGVADSYIIKEEF